uniref:Uncharacterized protein n=1 Tax=Salix viminalis TaxID=40686 RepID=A0A6N2LQT2_SALVM
MDNTVEISEATCSQLVMDWHTLSFSHRSSRHTAIHAYRPMKKHPFTSSLSQIETQAKSSHSSFFFSFILSWSLYLELSFLPFSASKIQHCFKVVYRPTN